MKLKMQCRYSLFFILYPIGIGAEWWLMMNAARVASTTLAAVYYFCLCLYVPGEYHHFIPLPDHSTLVLFCKPRLTKQAPS